MASLFNFTCSIKLNRLGFLRKHQRRNWKCRINIATIYNLRPIVGIYRCKVFLDVVQRHAVSLSPLVLYVQESLLWLDQSNLELFMLAYRYIHKTYTEVLYALKLLLHNTLFLGL